MLLPNYFSELRFRPRHDNLLVKLLPPAKETSSLLVEPDRQYRAIDAAWADVVAVGDGESYSRSCSKCERPFDRYADDVRVGDRVLLESDKAGDVVLIGNEEHRVVRMAEVLAVVEP